MISFSEAQDLVMTEARSFGKEKVRLADAMGRVIAEEIAADRDYPPFNRAAMDGYAIRQVDWEEGVRTFSIREIIFAGNSAEFAIEKGECYKIMTGAPVPDSANAIIRREDVLEKSSHIECVIENVQPSQHIAKRGGDLKKGDILFSRNIVCSPGMIGVLASIGIYEVAVERLPAISIITTGNEVVKIDSVVTAVQIRNSNSHVLNAMLKKWHIVSQTSAHVSDQVEAIQSAIQHALHDNIIIVTGGVSAGDADHVPAVLHGLGAKQIFHKVAIRPGKPVWFGKFDNGPVVFALPGNPLSCLVTCKIFIEYFLRCSFGIEKSFDLSLPLHEPRLKKTSVDEFFPVNISGIASGFEIIDFNGSGDITAAMHAQAIAIHPSGVAELSKGDIVNAYLL